MKIKVLVAGFGFMGQTHAGSLLKMPDVKLAGIIDPADLAERLTVITGNCATERITREELADIPHFSTLDEALENTDADAAIIALPTKLHHDAVIKCLDAGLHVFVEKPLAVSLAEGENMVKTADRNEKMLATGYVVRRMKEYMFLKETIGSGRLGKLQYLKMSRITGVPAWGNWSDPEFIRTSGGALFDLLSHDIDFACSCLGEPQRIESVKTPGNPQSQMISAFLHFRDADVSVEGGFITPSTFPFSCTFTACFENGTLNRTTPGKVTEYQKNNTIEHDFLPDNPYFTELENFINCLKNNTPDELFCSGSDAYNTILRCHEIARVIGYPLP